MFYRDRADGCTYEECPLCGQRAEVDSREDGQGWGRNHYAAYHEHADPAPHRRYPDA